jgi:hypothetical protein
MAERAVADDPPADEPEDGQEDQPARLETLAE